MLTPMFEVGGGVVRQSLVASNSTLGGTFPLPPLIWKRKYFMKIVSQFVDFISNSVLYL